MNLSGIILAGGKSRRLGMNKLHIMVGPVPLFIDQVFKLSLFCREIIISTSVENYHDVSRECSRIDEYLKYYYGLREHVPQNSMKALRELETPLKVPGIKIVIDEQSGIEVIAPGAGTGTEKIGHGSGPIAGIYTGLKNASNRYAFVLAFDMPFISFRLIKALEDALKEDCSCDAFIIKTEKGYEVLSGIYSKNTLDAFRDRIINKDNKISNIFKNIKVSVIKEADLRSRNIDMLNFFNINRKEDYKKFMDIWNGSPGPFLKRWKGFFLR